MRQAQISHFVTLALQVSSHDVPFSLVFEVLFLFIPPILLCMVYSLNLLFVERYRILSNTSYVPHVAVVIFNL